MLLRVAIPIALLCASLLAFAGKAALAAASSAEVTPSNAISARELAWNACYSDSNCSKGSECRGFKPAGCFMWWNCWDKTDGTCFAAKGPLENCNTDRDCLNQAGNVGGACAWTSVDKGYNQESKQCCPSFRKAGDLCSEIVPNGGKCKEDGQSSDKLCGGVGLWWDGTCTDTCSINSGDSGCDDDKKCNLNGWCDNDLTKYGILCSGICE